jgi:antitoxin (DNA-binding transcriptional repressor) of toxin-antitoxin stability system
MTRIDLDDLPPKIAAQLAAVGEGEELLLVQNGGVVARLTGAAAPPPTAPDPPAEPGEHIKEVFDHFRASIEDEF